MGALEMQDVKQTDEISGHEIAGHENAKHENIYWHILQHRHDKHEKQTFLL